MLASHNPWRKVQSVQSGTGRYEGSDGERHYRWWSPGDPRFVVIFGHGFGDHSGRYQRFADTVAGFGGAVFTPDYKGHGLSDGDRAVVEDFDQVASDYLAVTKVPSFPSGIPLFLAGQSMGGLVVSRAALLGQVEISGLVISGARIGGWPAGEDLVGKIDRGEVDPESGGGGHPILDPNVKLPPDALCRDESIFEEFVNDPLTHLGAYPVPTLRAYVRATSQLRGLSQVYPFPVLYMHGGADSITPYPLSVERIAQLAAEDLEVRIFPGARHSIYNELNRDEVFEVLRRFVERAIGQAEVPIEQGTRHG